MFSFLVCYYEYEMSDVMKKKVLIILLAVLSGSLLAFPVLTSKKIQKEPTVFSLYVLQTGVYSSYENALEDSLKNKNSIIYQDDGMYRVLVGASINESGLEKIESALKEEEIHYYKKKLMVVKEDDLLQKYNLMLEKTEEKEVILLLNQKILEKMV